MVRNYIRKGNRGEGYTKELLKKAVHEVKSGALTAFRASKDYNIPLTTIVDHVKGRRGAKSSSFGRTTALSIEEENKLVEGLCYMEKYGFGLSRKEVLELVGEYVIRKGLKTPFRNGIPSKDWFVSFKNRHKLSIKKPQSVEYARKQACDPFIISEYFVLLKNTLDELNLKDKPHLVWNLDETSFCRDPSKTRIVGKKGLPATRTVSSPGRENITVLLACSAFGEKAPPLIIFKGKNVWDQFMASKHTEFPGTTYAATSNGWMETSVFENWFKNSFLKTIGTQRPVLVICDGHSTHVGLTLVEMARQENIVILKLPPHSSHILQPLDLSVMKSLKVRWDAKLTKWQRHHIGVKLPKKEFSRMVGEIWAETSEDVIRNGFKKAGITPFNNRIIPEEMFDPRALQRWKQLNSENLNVEKMPPNSIHVTADYAEHHILEHCATTNFEVQVQQPCSSTPDTTFQDRPQCSSTLDSTVKIPDEISFEQLLLDTMKTHNTNEKIKKKRVCPGAEVITTDDAVQRLKENEINKKQKGVKTVCKKDSNFQKIKNKKSKLKKQNINKNNSSDESEYYSDCSSSLSENIPLSTFLRQEEEIAEENKTFKEVSEKKVGDWAIVKFSTKKSVKYYVGNILAISNYGETVVKFVRKSSEHDGVTVFHYPPQEDECEVTEEDFVSILPNPNIGRRGEVKFSVRFTSLNIQ